jgi:CCR4-NOT transcriptional regulation complex NOT5 subunit
MWKANQFKKKFSRLQESESNEQNEKLLEDCKDSIFKLRRLRLQMERSHGIKARKKLFEEHTNVNFEVESVEFEKMNEYLSLTEHQRMGLIQNNVQDNLIKKIVYR